MELDKPVHSTEIEIKMFNYDAIITLSQFGAEDELRLAELEPVVDGQGGDGLVAGQLLLEDHFAREAVTGVETAVAPAAHQFRVPVVVHVVRDERHDLVLGLVHRPNKRESKTCFT